MKCHKLLNWLALAFFVVLAAAQEPWVGFHKKSLDEQLRIVQENSQLTVEQINNRPLSKLKIL